MTVEFKRGDVVRLQSGGPLMTVLRYVPQNSPVFFQGQMRHRKTASALVTWFDINNQIQEQWFNFPEDILCKQPTL